MLHQQKTATAITTTAAALVQFQKPKNFSPSQSNKIPNFRIFEAASPEVNFFPRPHRGHFLEKTTSSPATLSPFN